jgi:hypothetical protein
MGGLASLALLLAPFSAVLAEPAPQIVWIDLAGTPAAVEMGAQREAGRLLRQLGIEASWRHGAPADVLEEGELAVVLVPRDRAAKSGAFVLGACNARSSTPRAWVFLDSLRLTLGLRTLDAPADSADLGVALGRIVAHEVVHAVAPGLDHAHDGLMSARFDRAALLGPILTIDPTTRRLLLRRSAVQRASSAGVSD